MAKPCQSLLAPQPQESGEQPEPRIQYSRGVVVVGRRRGRARVIVMVAKRKAAAIEGGRESRGCARNGLGAGSIRVESGRG